MPNKKDGMVGEQGDGKIRNYGHEARTRYLIEERRMTGHGEEGNSQSDRRKD